MKTATIIDLTFHKKLALMLAALTLPCQSLRLRLNRFTSSALSLLLLVALANIFWKKEFCPLIHNFIDTSECHEYGEKNLFMRCFAINPIINLCSKLSPWLLLVLCSHLHFSPMSYTKLWYAYTTKERVQWWLSFYNVIQRETSLTDTVGLCLFNVSILTG